jgi:phosphatidylglycerophosphatase C
VRLVIFDLDGTITRRDSFVPFIAGFLVEHPHYLARLWHVPGALLRYSFDGHNRGRLKESLMMGLLHGVERSTLAAWTSAFVDRLLSTGCRPQALEQIRIHRTQGDRLVLLSASPDLYVPEIGRRLGFDESISTGVRWEQDRLSGELTTQNRRGEEKVRVLEQLRARCPGLGVVAYGNSDSDFPHLQLADEGWLISRRRELVRRAQELQLKTTAWT